MERHDMGKFPYQRESGHIQHDYPNLSGETWQDISTGETISGLWVQMSPDKTNGATESNLPIGTEQLCGISIIPGSYGTVTDLSPYCLNLHKAEKKRGLPMETWAVDIKNSPAQLVENLIWPNGNYKADRIIVNGLRDLAKKGTVCFFDDDKEPCTSTVTIRGSQAEVQYEKPGNRRLDYGARHLVEIITKLMSGEISPEIASRISVNSCMRRA